MGSSPVGSFVWGTSGVLSRAHQPLGGRIVGRSGWQEFAFLSVFFGLAVRTGSSALDPLLELIPLGRATPWLLRPYFACVAVTLLVSMCGGHYLQAAVDIRLLASSVVTVPPYALPICSSQGPALALEVCIYSGLCVVRQLDNWFCWVLLPKQVV